MRIENTFPEKTQVATPIEWKNKFSDVYYTMASQRKCCGSSVLPNLDLDKNPQKLVQPGIFRRKIIGPVIHIINPSKPSDDSVPPSKIGDLKIRQLPGTSTPDRLVPEWTAPGGDSTLTSDLLSVTDLFLRPTSKT